MTAKSKTAKPRPSEGRGEENSFIEIVNWWKAQPTMKRGGGNDWLKLYTSLLEHDGWAGMDDSARMLIIALWLYAARSGLHILPADPQWLKRKIPMLNGTPDLRPLLDAADVYGEPTPFVRFCNPPKTKKAAKARPAGPTRSKSKTGTRVATRARRARKTRVEESRIEETEEREDREETKPLRVSKEKNRREKKRISTTEQQRQQRAAETAAEEPEKPENPIESEAGSAKGHCVPRPTRSAFSRSKPQGIGEIVNEWLPSHWQDPRAEQFGWEIVRALGYSHDPLNQHSRSEWGAFAAWWYKVEQSAPAMALEEIWTVAIGKANYLRTKGKSAKNRSAVWFHIMAGELNQRGVSITPPARASPL